MIKQTPPIKIPHEKKKYFYYQTSEFWNIEIQRIVAEMILKVKEIATYQQV